MSAGSSFNEVTFYAKVGGSAWKSIGTDDTRPYRVFHDVSAISDGTQVSYRAVVRDNAAHQRVSNSRRAQSFSAQADHRAAAKAKPQPRVISPVRTVTRTAPQSLVDSVTVAGSLQSEIGCLGDWDPACAAKPPHLQHQQRVVGGRIPSPRATMSTRWPSTTRGLSTTGLAAQLEAPTSRSASRQGLRRHLHLGSGNARRDAHTEQLRLPQWMGG